METVMRWNQVVKAFPDEWVALIDYQEDASGDVDGVVVTHNKDRQQFHETVGQLLPQYGDMAVLYTGPLIKDDSLPLLWQISTTE